MRVIKLLFAGTSLDKARCIFKRTTQGRPRIRLTIRKRMGVLDELPRHDAIACQIAVKTSPSCRSRRSVSETLGFDSHQCSFDHRQ